MNLACYAGREDIIREGLQRGKLISLPGKLSRMAVMAPRELQETEKSKSARYQKLAGSIQ